MTDVAKAGRAMAVAGFLVASVLAASPVRASDLIGSMRTMVTTYDDTILDIAHDNDLGLIEVMSANPGVDPWLPGANVTLTIPTAHILPDAPRKGIVINSAELRLYYYGDPKNPKSFPIGIGRDGYLTPHGTTTVARKKEKPNWYLTPSEIADHPELPTMIPPGPDNPLGSYALYLGWPSYLIHGTNTPWGVGRRVSRGCIRMYEEDIAWLFQRVEPGTPVNVVDQPVKLGRQDGELFIEVQPSSNQVTVMEETSKSPGPEEPLPIADWADRILIAAGPDMERLDWQAIESALSRRQGYPIQITGGSGTVTAARIAGESVRYSPQSEQPRTADTPAVAPPGATGASPNAPKPLPLPADSSVPMVRTVPR
ncbi:MAG: L,D-transpeptidase family protein [Rhodospirillales bacterium]